KGVKWRARDEGSAKCPFHEDRRASLSVNSDSGLWFCHACDIGGTARSFAERLRIEAPAAHGKAAESVLDYRDEKGALLYQVVRFAGKQFRQRRPDGKGAWIWNLDGVRRVPYRLPESLKSAGNIFVVEGEKDAETLRAQGLAATCNAGGAGKWRDEFGQHLQGRVCILIADNDEPGRNHVEDVARKLGPFAHKIISLGALPGSREHGDVSDWLAAGHTIEELLALVDAAEQKPDAPRASANAESNWPESMNEAALHGAAGEFVRLIEPHTEADPAALLVQFLVGFGNLCGPASFRFAGGVAHHLNEYAVIVGDTSRARKGTSWAEVERFLEKVDSYWTKECVTSGLSTGEGLIWHVRDPQEANGRGKGAGGENGDGNGRAPDPGVTDKRLMVQAGEFAAVLKVATRDGSTLSPVLREAWDSKTLRTLAKNSPATATGAHISITAHITHEELERALDSTEIANGFANRFAWVCARRSKLLPWGGTVQDFRLDRVADTVRRAAEQARKGGEFTFDDDAKRLWEQSYERLTDAKPGLLGAIVGRSEAHVLRFACIYAALDSSRAITAAHLNAALALWNYCERSARHIFGNRLGNPDADAILEALKDRPQGLTRTEIRNLFSRNLSGDRIDRARDALIKARLIRVETDRTDGRPAERWIALEQSQNGSP
ncbi:MAG TPA: DUF3987 domain-containing protein, partial [Candidatus Binataceae bacterium]|nr:DUF3987 domain-containing protein [Candidatus Binataceae bacterium]